MTIRSAAILSVLIAAGGVGSARGVDLPPPYRAHAKVEGTIRIWGHGAYDRSRDFIGALVNAWERGFNRVQPGVRFENHLVGTATAIGALYTGRGDLALMGREIWPPEIEAFTEVFGYPPTGLGVVTGSLAVRNRDYALVVFVNKDNPISQLTLAQLDAIFGVERRRGGQAVRTWGDLGLAGSWRDRPIHRYGLPISRGFARFFEDKVLLGSLLWQPSLREFADIKGSRGAATDGGQRMVDAMASDPNSIGYAGLLYHNPRVKPLALAATPDGPYAEPTERNVMNHSYPLTRTVSMFLNRKPATPVDAKLAEFLRYVLSREGQQAVLSQGHGYLPVLAPLAAQELTKIE
jgi:phosphate transport system substrate-binding protein